MTLRHRRHRIIYIPADDRPVSTYWPRLFGRMIDWETLLPPAELLGWFTDPGKPEEIIAWALDAAREPVDAAVVSLDMLAYGGWLAGQGPWTRTQLAQRRMSALAQLREAIGDAPILGFGAILGLGAWTRSDRLRQYTDSLREYSVLAAEAGGEAEAETRARLHQIESSIPAAVLGEYLAIRGRNHEINRRSIEELAKGNLDYLILAQSDAAEAGLHREEQEDLLRLAAELGVSDRLSICSGGPEQGLVLMARAVHRHMNKIPRVAVLYSTGEGASRTGEGDDRPLREQVAATAANIGGEMADEGADITAVINCPLPVARDVVYHIPAYDSRKAA
ncbi:MAG: DUF4127 family protein, partial [Armatimonadetes bacterium]|nr:DUF4127 family protein [Armatimonadota bacterium]